MRFEIIMGQTLQRKSINREQDRVKFKARNLWCKCYKKKNATTKYYDQSKVELDVTYFSSSGAIDAFENN